MSDLIEMCPQPKRGKPFQIAGCQSVDGQDPRLFWFNERIGWPRVNKMVFQWKCPFGANGEPVLIAGTWYWRRREGV